MRRAEKMENIKEEMINAKQKILSLAENRWKGSGDFYDDDFRIIYSGGNEYERGIAIILDIVTSSCVTDI